MGLLQMMSCDVHIQIWDDSFNLNRWKERAIVGIYKTEKIGSN